MFMRYVKNAIRHMAIVTSIFLLGVAAGCSKPADKPLAATPSAATQNAPSKLGDLSEFQGIAKDVAGRVDNNDLPGAKIRIKDLETRWDSAEAGIKPRAASDWHRLDKAIDNALSALRAGSPTQAECKAAMDELLKTFTTLQGQ
jgi:hypothetical protein